jgi:predicted DNA-binding protein (MmcQ/YjbR family)
VLNTGGGIPVDELREAIDTSYELVLSGLPKKFRHVDPR